MMRTGWRCGTRVGFRPLAGRLRAEREGAALLGAALLDIPRCFSKGYLPAPRYTPYSTRSWFTALRHCVDTLDLKEQVWDHNDAEARVPRLLPQGQIEERGMDAVSGVMLGSYNGYVCQRVNYTESDEAHSNGSHLAPKAGCIQAVMVL
jgi:hypothetical protein